MSTEPRLESVSDRVNFAREEAEVLAFWEKIQAFETSLELNKDKPVYTFYDGPPFATGLPHYGHILAGTIKDIVTRYASQTGYSVSRRFGWDTHGLPVEFEIDQKLGIKSKADVMKIGVPAYNAECRAIVQRYTKEWEATVKRMGRWIDFKNDYKTMDTSFMESVWWVFGQLYEKGLVYRGYKVMPYSTGCTTPLSNFEAGQNFKMVKDPAVVVNFPLKSDANTQLLAWTTTPWTLPSNLALAVNPTMKYVLLKDKKTNVNYWIHKKRVEELYPSKKKGAAQPVAKSKAEKEDAARQAAVQAEADAAPLQSTADYDVVQEVDGTHLVGMQYVPMFDYFVSSQPNSYRVIAGDFVTDDSGTGIVHCAPGFGEEDFNACLASGITKKGDLVLCPVDDNGCFTSEVTDFEGRYVKDADKDIIRLLKEKGRILKVGQIDHQYPFCWRSETPLLYKVVPSWFVNVEKIKDRLLERNQETYWVPSFVQEKRFHNWLRDARDWAISRSRYWGTPLPIWVSEDEEEVVIISSIKQLEELSGVTGITDLHKDKIDHITIPSQKGKGVLKPCGLVFDCWFESGSMPYAQQHYPFENREVFEKGFPADFVAEGLDQTRGWFYTLMVISTALFDKPAFKNLIVNGLVLAADGKKMSKRLKNYPDPLEVVDKYCADALRIYLINSPVVRAEPLKFQEEGVKDVVRNVLLPWFHAYRFFVENALRFESVTGEQFRAEIVVDNIQNPAENYNVMDRWIVSSFQSLVAFVRTEMAAYRLYTVTPRLLSFIEQLTNWYVRMNRRRLKATAGATADAMKDTRRALSVLHYVLISLCRLMAPFTPFFVEMLYRNLRHAMSESETPVESIHFLDIPVENAGAKDEAIERVVSRMQRVVELGRTARQNRNLTLSQPLSSFLICNPDQSYLDDIMSLESYIRDELNVKTVTCSSEQDKYISLMAAANGDILGKKYRKALRQISVLISALTSDQLRQMQKDGSVKLTDPATNESWTIDADEIEITWKFIGEATQESVSGDDVLVVLDVTDSQELREEGIVRDLMREVQKMRKKAGLVATDPVEVFYSCKKVDVPAVAPAKVEKPKAEKPKAEPKAEAADAKGKGKGKKDSKAAPVVAAPVAAPVVINVDVDQAVHNQTALISATLNAPFINAADMPPVIPKLLESTVSLDPLPYEVVLTLARPSVKFHTAALKAAAQNDAELVRKIELFLGSKQLDNLRSWAAKSPISFAIDGKQVQLEEGKHFYF